MRPPRFNLDPFCRPDPDDRDTKGERARLGPMRNKYGRRKAGNGHKDMTDQAQMKTNSRDLRVESAVTKGDCAATDWGDRSQSLLIR